MHTPLPIVGSGSTRARAWRFYSVLFGDVDLRLLQAPRVVHVQGLPLGEDVERGLAGLAVAVAGLLRAAERQVDLGADRAGVDVCDPGVEIAHRAERPVDVADRKSTR